MAMAMASKASIPSKTSRIEECLPSPILSRRMLLACPAINLAFKFQTAIAAEPQPVPQNELIQKLLKKSQENKEKYAKERLDAYYKRNYKEYFEFIEPSLRKKAQKGQLSEAEKGILQWLDKNR